MWLDQDINNHSFKHHSRILGSENYQLFTVHTKHWCTNFKFELQEKK